MELIFTCSVIVFLLWTIWSLKQENSELAEKLSISDKKVVELTESCKAAAFFSVSSWMVDLIKSAAGGSDKTKLVKVEKELTETQEELSNAQKELSRTRDQLESFARSTEPPDTARK